jgi:flavin reductase (DIM6/NTAB) family NADH-FMN oxidoreductase RutF
MRRPPRTAATNGQFSKNGRPRAFRHRASNRNRPGVDEERLLIQVDALLPSGLWPSVRACGTSLTQPAHGDSAGRPQGFTTRDFRDALAQFATGVTVICAPGPESRFVGFTANSFNSVSLDPPLVVWSLDRRAVGLEAFENAERYAINVLGSDQVELARRFSRPHADRFAGVAYRMGKAGVPLIEGCVAWFECRQHARHRTGDHILFIGQVETCKRTKGRGLVFHHGRFGTTHPLE